MYLLSLWIARNLSPHQYDWQLSFGSMQLVGPIDILAPASKHLINFNPPRYVNDNFGVSIASFMPWDQVINVN